MIVRELTVTKHNKILLNLTSHHYVMRIIQIIHYIILIIFQKLKQHKKFMKIFFLLNFIF